MGGHGRGRTGVVVEGRVDNASAHWKCFFDISRGEGHSPRFLRVELGRCGRTDVRRDEWCVGEGLNSVERMYCIVYSCPHHLWEF